MYKPSLAIVFILSQAISPAHAYLDPGTGSILIQSLIAALAAGAYALKMYWHRIKAYFAKEGGAVLQLDQSHDSEERGEHESR